MTKFVHYQKTHITLLILILSLFSLPSFSLGKVYNDHFITASISAGYSSLQYDLPAYDGFTQVGGLGAGLGFGYELHHGFFLFNLGVDFEYLNASDEMANFEYVTTLIDTEGDNVTYHYDFQNYQATTSYGYFNVPIGIGFTTQSVYGYVGAKIGLNMMGSTTTNIDYRTLGNYDRFIDDFEDMPDHFFTNYSNETSGDVTLLTNIAAQAEFGFYLGGKRLKKGNSYRYRLGFFAEYGFQDVFNEAPSTQLMVFKGDAPNVELNSLLTSTDMSKVDVLPLFVGLRLTFMYEFPKPPSCHCIGTYQPRIKRYKR